MKAQVGDMLMVRSHHVGAPDRVGEIIEVRGADGDPPYVVRWGDGGAEGLFFPGSDATIQRQQQ
jgi:hypothetical protein